MASLGHPSKFQQVSRLAFVTVATSVVDDHGFRSTDVAHRRQTNLCTIFGRLLGWYTIYTFSGALAPLTEFCLVHYSLSVQVLRSPILAALLHGTLAAGVSQTLRRGTRNGITELSQRAPPTFGRAAITLGIGPHSSFSYLLHPQAYTLCSLAPLVSTDFFYRFIFSIYLQ